MRIYMIQIIKDRVKNFNVYDYLAEGQTVYDFISSQLGIEDFSSSNMIKYIRSYNNTKVSEGRIIYYRNRYDEIFKILSFNLREALSDYTTDPKIRKFSKEEKDQLLKELQSISSNRFDKIEDYISYLNDVNNNSKFNNLKKDRNYLNEEQEKLSEIIINKALEVTPKETERIVRGKAVRLLLTEIDYEQQNITPGSSVEDRENYIKNRVFMEIFSSNENFLKYEELLDEVKSQIDKYNKDCVARVESKKFKEEYIKETLKDVIPTRTKKVSERKNTRNFGDDIVCQFKFFRQPKLILDEDAIYQEGGLSNDHVTAFSYGKLRYSALHRRIDGSPTYKSDLVELIGITRKNDESSKTYFVFMPVDNIELSYDAEGVPKSDKRSLLLNGRKAKILDQNGREMQIIGKKRIPDRAKEFYAKTYFSEENLEDAVYRGDRFLPRADVDKNGNAEVRQEYVYTDFDRLAVKKLLSQRIAIGDRVYNSFEDFITYSLEVDHFLNVIRQEEIRNEQKKDDIEFFDL